jgi:hypothetical protein
MKLLKSIKFTFILILCATLISCDKDDPVVCNSIAVHGGDKQGGVVGHALPNPLQVLVTDASGKPLSNVTVRWEVTGGGGSLSSATSTTDGEGIATTNWTYGQSAGRARASVENPSGCQANSVEFTSEPLALALNASSTRIEPLKLKSDGQCYEFNYIIGFNSNGDLSKYFIDVEGEYQYETQTSPTTYFATGNLSADGKSVTFPDCFQFQNDSYIDEWFKISLYNLSDILHGEPREGATPVITSNRIGPIRTMRPAGAPRLATGMELPSASRSGRR